MDCLFTQGCASPRLCRGFAAPWAKISHLLFSPLSSLLFLHFLLSLPLDAHPSKLAPLSPRLSPSAASPLRRLPASIFPPRRPLALLPSPLEPRPSTFAPRHSPACASSRNNRITS